MKNRILSALLAAMLLLGAFACTASAESAPALNPYDLSMTVGNKVYTFPMSASEMTAMGVNLSDVSGLGENQYFYALPADNGRSAFDLRVEYCFESPEDPIVTGCNLKAEKHAGISVGGVVVGQTTRKEVIDAFGEAKYTSGTRLTYYTLASNYVWNIDFESESDSAKVTGLDAHTELPKKYGVNFGDQVGVQDANLPDPTAMAFNAFILDGKHYASGDTLQKLMDNGWKVPMGVDVEKVIDGAGSLFLSGETFYMYNGESLIHVGAYNRNKEQTKLADCCIYSIQVSSEWNSSMIIADGYEPGSATLADIEVTFGPLTSEEENKYTATVLDHTKYEFYADDSGNVYSIWIGKLF